MDCRSAVLTFKFGLQDELLVEPFAVTWLHGIADFGGVGAHGLPHVVQGVGHGVHRVYHKHYFGLLLKRSVPQAALTAARFLQATAKAVLPELFEPRVPGVGVRVQFGKVIFELTDRVGCQLDGERAVRRCLASSHHALLCPPPIAGHPGEGDIHARRGHQQLTRVLTAGEQDHHPGIGLLLQGADDVVVALAVHGSTHLGRGGDADLARAGFLLEGVDASLAVVTFRGHCRHVCPVKVAQDLCHGLGLVEIRRHGAGEVVVAAFVTQLGAGGGVADLRDLEQPQKVGHLEKKKR